jgi:L-fuconolactonase
VPPFVDSHVHFWNQGLLPYPWLAQVPAIAGVHLPADLRAEAAPDLPDRIVMVQADCDRGRWLEEVLWVERLAAAEPRIAAMVAHAPMDEGDRTTAAIAELARHPLVRGVRHLIQGEPSPDFCLRSEFVAGVRRVGEAGLTFDLCCRHHQLPAVVELVRRCPATNFVLDHAGKPDLRSGALGAWSRAIGELGACAHVACKVSGLATEADPARWTPDQLRPVFDHLYAAFGADRLLFGSDWPVLKLASTYGRWLATVRLFTAQLTPPEQDAIFRRTAAGLYHLD